MEYDERRCAGCFMCVMNCPFGVLKPDSPTKSRIIKCDFCIDSGGEPSCVKACPKKAIAEEIDFTETDFFQNNRISPDTQVKHGTPAEINRIHFNRYFMS